MNRTAPNLEQITEVPDTAPAEYEDVAEDSTSIYTTSTQRSDERIIEGVSDHALEVAGRSILTSGIVALPGDVSGSPLYWAQRSGQGTSIATAVYTRRQSNGDSGDIRQLASVPVATATAIDAAGKKIELTGFEPESVDIVVFTAALGSVAFSRNEKDGWNLSVANYRSLPDVLSQAVTLAVASDAQ
jgi:hypothetical protein